MKIGILFNHEQLHQIPHAAGVGYELSRLYDDVKVSFLTSSPSQAKYLRQFESAYPGHRCRFVDLDMPGWLRGLGHWLDRALPFTKVAMLHANLELFRNFDALVVPEKTSLLLRSRFGLEGLKFIYTAHGAGDRAIGFDPALAEFDLIFLAGPKIERRMRASGLLDKADSHIVGYPKFDTVLQAEPESPRLFDNDRPTVLYNPHFDPVLSSWYPIGRQILEYFRDQDSYNLILAPHVMLYRRRFHLAPNLSRVGMVRNLPSWLEGCSHIHVDTHSTACNDMTYTRLADIYLGDVSSQIWEFLHRPRPCLFANPHRIDWHENPDYLHWRTGTVFEDADLLGAALEQAVQTHADYLPVQTAMFEDTFELTGECSSHRAARAIMDFMNRTEKNPVPSAA